MVMGLCENLVRFNLNPQCSAKKSSRRSRAMSTPQEPAKKLKGILKATPRKEKDDGLRYEYRVVRRTEMVDGKEKVTIDRQLRQWKVQV